MSFERFVGNFVVTKVELPSDKRGIKIPAHTTLFISELVGTEHFNLNWPGTNKRAANQVHYTKLYTNDIARD